MLYWCFRWCLLPYSSAQPYNLQRSVCCRRLRCSRKRRTRVRSQRSARIMIFVIFVDLNLKMADIPAESTLSVKTCRRAVTRQSRAKVFQESQAIFFTQPTFAQRNSYRRHCFVCSYVMPKAPREQFFIRAQLSLFCLSVRIHYCCFCFCL